MLIYSNNFSDYDRTILDLVPFPMWIYDMDTFRFLAVNKEAICQYGYSEEEFMQMTIKDIRPIEDIPKLEKAVERARKRRKQYKESLFRHQKRNGRIIYVRLKSNHINFEDKRAELVTAIDLTDRYEREQKIVAQQDFLKAIGKINKLLLKSNNWIKSLEGCFKIVGHTIDIDRIYFYQNNLNDQTTFQRLAWNRPSSKQKNAPVGHLPLSEFPLFIGTLKAKRHFEAIVDELPSSPIKTMLQSHEIKSIIVLPVWVDEAFYGFIGFNDCNRHRKFSDNEFQLLHALTSNLAHVLKEHHAYQELFFSEGRYKSLIENGRDLVAVIDAVGNYKYVAPTSKTVLGIPPEEFLGKNAFDFIYEKDVPRLMEQLAKIQESKYVSIEPYRFPDANGNLRWIRTELSNHLNTPLIEGIVANTHEVTDEIKQKIANDLVIELTLAFAKPISLAFSLNEVLRRLVLLPKVSMSEIWLVSPDESQLNLVSKACQHSKFEVFHQKSKDFTSCKKEEGLPGMVWKEKTVVIWKDLIENNHFVRSGSAKIADLSTGIGLPVMYADQFLGCILCFSVDTADHLLEEVHLLTNVSGKLGALVKQKITEEEYRNFFNISPDPHCLIGFDGYIKKCNKAFFNLFGHQKDGLYSTSLFQFIHIADRERAREDFDALISGHSMEPFAGRFLTDKGELKWLLWSATVAAESKTVIAVGKDITEQKHAEQALQTAYERLKTAQKIAKLGYWFRDIGSDISVWSDETYKIYECSAETFIPSIENIKQTLQTKDRYLMEDDPSLHLEPGKTQSFEHEIITLFGKLKWVRQEVRLLTNEQGSAFKIEGTIQDITASRQSMERIKKQNDNLKEIAWLQSHIIRAPLSRIMGLVYLSKELDGGGKSTNELMDMIMESAKELDEVIGQITVKTNLINDENTTYTTD